MIQNEIMKSSGRTPFVAPQMLAMDGGGRLGAAFQDGQSEAAQKIERAIAYMAEHINRPLQVATLAAMANVSPSHFFALFKQCMGCPPMDYFTRLRMRHACRLLDSGSASVKEVAAELGYDDPFYFSRVFKSVNNIPPSQYRGTQAMITERPAHGSMSMMSAGN
jgi:AraC-like DNA-binding protein